MLNMVECCFTIYIVLQVYVPRKVLIVDLLSLLGLISWGL